MKNTNIKIQTKLCFDKWYKEYQKFMGWNDAPKYKLKFYYSKEHCTSYHDIEKNNLHIISINELLIPTHHNNAKAIAFHEFTHIYDHCNMNDDYLLNICGEYHAVSIQMKCALNFKSINDKVQIKETDLVYDGIKTQCVKDYLIYITKDAKDTIKYLLNRNDVKHFIEAIRHSIYYFAKVDFFVKYIEDIKRISMYYDIFFLTKLFGVDIVALHILLQKLDLSDKEKLSEIHNLICEMGAKYIKDNKV